MNKLKITQKYFKMLRFLSKNKSRVSHIEYISYECKNCNTIITTKNKNYGIIPPKITCKHCSNLTQNLMYKIDPLWCYNKP